MKTLADVAPIANSAPANIRTKRSALQSHWTNVAGWRMHSRSSVGIGGIPFVLVHGLVISSVYFVPLAECLGGEVDVHAVDLPGFGRSTGPTFEPPVPATADFLMQWMRLNGIDRCHLVANSLGCQIAGEVADRFPDLVASLTLIGPTIDPAAHRISTQAVRLVNELLHQPPTLLWDLAMDFLRCGPVRMISMISRMFAHRLEQILPDIPAPTLVMRGERDPIAPESWIEEAARLLPQGQSITIPGGHHCVHYSNPRRVAELLLEFAELASLEPQF